MKRALFLFLPFILAACGSSPERMAEKSCDLISNYYAAKQAGDSSKMKIYEFKFDSLNKALMSKYEHTNPEWLLKFNNHRNQCIIDLKIK